MARMHESSGSTCKRVTRGHACVGNARVNDACVGNARVSDACVVNARVNDACVGNARVNDACVGNSVLCSQHNPGADLCNRHRFVRAICIARACEATPFTQEVDMQAAALSKRDALPQREGQGLN
eukprot:358413-Chlamydomonas_euryale.AAC.5